MDTGLGITPTVRCITNRATTVHPVTTRHHLAIITPGLDSAAGAVDMARALDEDLAGQGGVVGRGMAVAGEVGAAMAVVVTGEQVNGGGLRPPLINNLTNQPTGAAPPMPC